jgi:hypothetical protein
VAISTRASSGVAVGIIGASIGAPSRIDATSRVINGNRPQNVGYRVATLSHGFAVKLWKMTEILENHPRQIAT